MQNGVSPGPTPVAAETHAVARDAREAIVLAEGAIVEAIDLGGGAGEDGLALPSGGHNAFGERVVLEPPTDIVARVRRAADRASAGQRVGLIASSAELVAARDGMTVIAANRLGVVFHALETKGAEAALALADLGWGLLFASDVEDSLDLTLVARRAAEDSGTPFLVVHDLATVRRVEPLAELPAHFVEAFVGPAAMRIRRITDPGHPSHAQVSTRAFAERVPFALSSALRELESLTGRKRDLLTRSPVGQGADAASIFVALGALGDVLLGEIPRLRAKGHDVGAVKLTAFRPFPGPRVVRALARALTVTILEHTDEPLAQSNPLTREVKAAFADALTWAPEYPGVGRIPRIHSGVARLALHDIEAHDLDAIMQNMLAGEQGRRFFVLGGDPTHALAVSPRAQPAATSSSASASPVFHMRGVLRDVGAAGAGAELATAVIAKALTLKVRAAIRPLAVEEGGGFAFDLVAASHRPLGVHLASALSLVVFDDMSSLIVGNPVVRLAPGGTLAFPTRSPSAEAVWADMPPYVKAIVFDRAAHVLAWHPARAREGTAADAETERWLSAAAFVGVALAILAQPTAGVGQVDASLVEREVELAVLLLASADVALAERAGAVARRAFEAHVVVPHAIMAGDEASVRLGRKDARAASAS